MTLLEGQKSFACLETVREERMLVREGMGLALREGFPMADLHRDIAGFDRDRRRDAIGESSAENVRASVG